jgi:phosphatidylserine/phosphatidylglycerophosphate/cardiolipin synthase-like enzyme
MAGKTAIRAYANCDDAYVAWRLPKPVPKCRGFALFREREGEEPAPVDTWVPWAGQPLPKPLRHKPSTEWPIQRFMWSDFGVRSGQVVRYRAVPMVGKAGDLEQDEDHATGWSDWVEVGPQAEKGLQAWFNRGVLATQSLARRLGKSEEPWTKQLTKIIATPGDPIRNYLSGDLRPAMLNLLREVKDDGGRVRAALFELDDPELIAALTSLGERAEVVLANGSSGDEDENSEARKTLRKADVKVFNRMTGDRLAHNKFLVRLNSDGEPVAVWTGSTNWERTALCTQVNNGLLVTDRDVAGAYDAQWKALKEAGNEFPKELVNSNDKPKDAVIGPDVEASAWFVPVHDQVDLSSARDRIEHAEEGILFLAFNPGKSGTLIHDAMSKATTDGTGLYLHGVLNQDPGQKKGDASVGLVHRGQLDEANPDIVLPAAVDERFGPWEKEIRSYNIVMVHSKVIVCDPFGKKPVVMTGSHNLGPRASEKNDDNLLIIEEAPRLAAAYAVNIMAIYNAYRWRYLRSQQAKQKGDDWDGLADSDDWQDEFFEAPRQRELRFFLGEG